MFNLLVSTSLRHRLFVLAAALMLVIYGTLVLPRLPVDVLPTSHDPPSRLWPRRTGWPLKKSKGW